MTRVLAAALAALLVIAVPAVGLAGWPEPFAAFGLVRFDSGIRAPEFTSVALDGTRVSLPSPGRAATVLMFWATW